MEDSFRVRVDRTFGSLSSSSQPPSSSLWCLTDEEIERREWNRETSDAADEEEAVGPPPPFPSNLDGFFLANRTLEAADEKYPSGAVEAKDYRQQLEDDLQCLDDDEGDDVEVDGGELQRFLRGGGSSIGSRIPEDFEGDEDEWEVKNSIGMDCTLDDEEEEDEYDKVALDRIKSCDRIYLGDFGDYGVHATSSHNELPENFKDVSRDPRADHSAAELRLKEDAEAAKIIDSLQVSSEAALKLTNEQNNKSEVGNHHHKSILKRKENEMVQMDSLSDKRVRFVSGCKENDDKASGGDKDVTVETYSDGQNSISMVPDYIRNPSRYTHYTFDDSDDMDDRSNQQVCMGFLNALRKSKQLEPDEPPADLSQPVIFNPKRKSGGGSVAKIGNRSDMEKGSLIEGFARKKNLQVGTMAGDAQVEDGMCAMDEDAPLEMEAKINKRNTATQQYRSRVNVESDDLNS